MIHTHTHTHTHIIYYVIILLDKITIKLLCNNKFYYLVKFVIDLYNLSHYMHVINNKL